MSCSLFPHRWPGACFSSETKQLRLLSCLCPQMADQNCTRYLLCGGNGRVPRFVHIFPHRPQELQRLSVRRRNNKYPGTTPVYGIRTHHVFMTIFISFRNTERKQCCCFEGMKSSWFNEDSNVVLGCSFQYCFKGNFCLIMALKWNQLVHFSNDIVLYICCYVRYTFIWIFCSLWWITIVL